jgi:putative SOS response-associated peptidase YedK
MCGRTSLFIPQPVLEDRFDAELVADGGYEPRYNISPGQPLHVIPNDATDEIDSFHWGFLPAWADDLSDGFINARSETAAEKQAFRDAWEQRTCLVLSSGFYEWQETGGPKQPYRIYREDDPAFAMAGIWQKSMIKGETVQSVAILTTEPNDLMEPIHDRMPVVLPRSAENEWLTADADEREALCEPYPGDDLTADEISKKVNDPSTEDASIIEPLDTEQSGLGDFSD